MRNLQRSNPFGLPMHRMARSRFQQEAVDSEEEDVAASDDEEEIDSELQNEHPRGSVYFHEEKEDDYDFNDDWDF